MADKYQNKYRIPSARLQNWDYSTNAAYFVTICIKNREYYFGDIVQTLHATSHPPPTPKSILQLSKIGLFAQQCWMEIPQHFPFAKLGAFVIMPNHVHGIVIINKMGNAYSEQKGDMGGVETLHATSLPPKNEKMASISPKPGTLSTIIRSYKSAVTKNARKINPGFAWQSRFHDHIIRNNESFERIQRYIINNPLNWKNDKLNN